MTMMPDIPEPTALEATNQQSTDMTVMPDTPVTGYCDDTGQEGTCFRIIIQGVLETQGS